MRHCVGVSILLRHSETYSILASLTVWPVQFDSLKSHSAWIETSHWRLNYRLCDGTALVHFLLPCVKMSVLYNMSASFNTAIILIYIHLYNNNKLFYMFYCFPHECLYIYIHHAKYVFISWVFAERLVYLPLSLTFCVLCILFVDNSATPPCIHTSQRTFLPLSLLLGRFNCSSIFTKAKQAIQATVPKQPKHLGSGEHSF